MGKILREKAKRSLPILVILCLINFFAVGVSFNLNFDILNFSTGKLLTSPFEAEAADQASTTVIVRNAPPAISGTTENPTSTSTTPINVGGSIGFQATGTDGEGNDYWLLICTTNNATTTGSDPHCVGGVALCTSTQTSNNVQASCTYNNVTDPGSEMQTWYAFVCDNHATDAQCSTGAQGSGDGGSPFYVNHAPRFEKTWVSVDNQDPGGIFTFYASSTDDDITGGFDDLELFICSTNSWSVGGTCADVTLCTGSSTSPDVTCNYDDTEPTPHGAYAYYAFIKDWHNLAAAVGNGTTTDYHVNDVAPAVSNVTLNGGGNITLNIKNAGGKDVLVASNSVTDNNGCTDMTGATSTAYFGNVANGADCSANNNNCYQMASGNCVLSSCDGVDDATATYTCSSSFAFYTVPTDADAGAAAFSWFARLAAADGSAEGAGSYTTLNGVEVVSAAAMEVTETEITYGTIQANGNTGSRNSTTTVVNFGNTPIDTDLTGEDMLRNSVGPEIIGIENQEYGLDNFAWGAGTNTSSSTAGTVDVVINRPTSEVDVEDEIYWGIGIPTGTPSDPYEGYNTFTVVED
jgi:hypothetical protein